MRDILKTDCRIGSIRGFFAMRSHLIGLASALIALLGAAAAHADNLGPFNAAMEDVAAHNRAALGHLADHDAERAAAEIRKMQEAWGTFAQHFSGERPAAFRDNRLYVTMLVDVPTRIVTAMMMLDFGRPAIAENSLQAIRREMSAVRRESGVEVLADAVLDANARMDTLAAALDHAPDWSTPAAVSALATKAEAYGAAIRRCKDFAPEPVRDAPEFHRIVEGVTASLDMLATAIADRDAAALRRVIDELRSLDSLLAARYG
jgi:hypothetical protein